MLGRGAEALADLLSVRGEARFSVCGSGAFAFGAALVSSATTVAGVVTALINGGIDGGCFLFGCTCGIPSGGPPT